MNKELKKQWVDALRGGNYKQGKMVLRNNQDEYCCLGVLCDLINPNDWQEIDLGWMYENGCTAVLSNSILEKTGLRFIQSGHLATLNDNGYTFAQIADKIEEIL